MLTFLGKPGDVPSGLVESEKGQLARQRIDTSKVRFQPRSGINAANPFYPHSA
jgi:hypothetical protein